MSDIRTDAQRAKDRARIGELLLMWPREIPADCLHMDHALILRMRRALQEERRRSLNGDYAYNPNRHREIFHIFERETRECRALEAEGAPHP